MNQFEYWIAWRTYCETMAMKVLDGSVHLTPIDNDSSIQKKRDYFLYKYYEYNFNKAEKIISKLSKLWAIH